MKTICNHKRTAWLLSVILALAMFAGLFGAISFTAFAADTNFPEGNGDGTAGNPFIIKDSGRACEFSGVGERGKSRL